MAVCRVASLRPAHALLLSQKPSPFNQVTPDGSTHAGDPFVNPGESLGDVGLTTLVFEPLRFLDEFGDDIMFTGEHALLRDLELRDRNAENVGERQQDLGNEFFVVEGPAVVDGNPVMGGDGLHLGKSRNVTHLHDILVDEPMAGAEVQRLRRVVDLHNDRLLAGRSAFLFCRRLDGIRGSHRWFLFLSVRIVCEKIAYASERMIELMYINFSIKRVICQYILTKLYFDACQQRHVVRRELGVWNSGNIISCTESYSL